MADPLPPVESQPASPTPQMIPEGAPLGRAGSYLGLRLAALASRARPSRMRRRAISTGPEPDRAASRSRAARSVAVSVTLIPSSSSGPFFGGLPAPGLLPPRLPLGDFMPRE